MFIVLRKYVFALFAFAITGFAFAGPIDGSWEGKLQTGGMPLRVVFNISSAEDGSLKATLDSPDQGAYGIAVDKVSFTNNELRCSIDRINGAYTGTLNEATRTIDGTWTQFSVPLSLTLAPKVATVLNRPQVPTKPYPYLEEEVSFENTKAQVKFAGTLTKPKQGKKFPAVVLITGSGPQNRDEEIFGHKPFLIIADSLTRRGIAVLRVDDRGVGGSSRGTTSPTSEDFAQDVLAAIDYLKTRGDIDKKHIGLIGHSEGGLIAPMVANQSQDAAFIVLLAGPGVRGVELLETQGDAIQAAQGTPEIARAMNSRLQRALFDIALRAKDEESALASFDSYWIERTKETSGPFVSQGAQNTMMDALGKQLRSQVKTLMSPWMQFFLKYDPAPALQKVRCPVLAINGSLDTQVVAKQNLPPIDAALKAGGNKDYLTRELPGLNHMFQAAKTGAPSEYINIDETIDPSALQVVGDWVVSHASVSGKH